jgi:hypothetical protein
MGVHRHGGLVVRTFVTSTASNSSSSSSSFSGRLKGRLGGDEGLLIATRACARLRPTLVVGLVDAQALPHRQEVVIMFSGCCCCC